jgi:hypothetical protein
LFEYISALEARQPNLVAHKGNLVLLSDGAIRLESVCIVTVPKHSEIIPMQLKTRTVMPVVARVLFGTLSNFTLNERFHLA